MSAYEAKRFLLLTYNICTYSNLCHYYVKNDLCATRMTTTENKSWSRWSWTDDLKLSVTVVFECLFDWLCVYSLYSFFSPARLRGCLAGIWVLPSFFTNTLKVANQWSSRTWWKPWRRCPGTCSTSGRLQVGEWGKVCHMLARLFVQSPGWKRLLSEFRGMQLD